jgi:hypothetical protein
MPIAIFHCSIKIISRGKGKSAVAAAAYRAGEKILCEYDERLSDYTRNDGVVIPKFCCLKMRRPNIPTALFCGTPLTNP